MITENDIIDLFYTFVKRDSLLNLYLNNVIPEFAKAILDKIKEDEEQDLSYEKDCPEAFGFDNYGSNNG
jgi:hypothetical protein